MKLSVFSDSVLEFRTSSLHTTGADAFLAQWPAVSWPNAYYDIRGGGRLEYFQAALKKRISGLGASERLPLSGPGGGMLKEDHYCLTFWNLNEAVRGTRVYPLEEHALKTLAQYIKEVARNFQRSMLVVGGDPTY